MKSIKSFLVIAIGFMMLFGALNTPDKEVKSQTSVSGTQAFPGTYTSSTVSFRVVFSSDSLLNAKTNLFGVLPYTASLSTFSWKASGTVKNFRINAYLTNFKTSDTTYWTLINQWDTTGNYTAKPVIDTLGNALITGTAGLPMRYCAFQVKGLAGNREDVIVECEVAFRRNY